MFQRLLLLLLLLGTAVQSAFAIETGSPSGLEGTISMKGSDSIDPLVRLWVSEFQKQNPKVEIRVESPGSNTAPPALTSGEVQLGHMSREMNADELAAFLNRKGYPVTRLIVALDALGIYVHRSNPLGRILVDQVDAIYSRSRLSGWDRPLERWGDLGLTGVWDRRDIHFFGRDEKSGTRVFFEEKVLGKGGTIRRGYQERDQWGVVESVAKDPAGIGYAPINYINPEVRMVPVVALGSGRGYLPTSENMLSGRYPLTRRLNLYLDKAPGKPLPTALLGFLRFILGPEGQRLVQEYGSVPVTREILDAQLLSLEQ
jgi:phosphate transport system substrate-binding protein